MKVKIDNPNVQRYHNREYMEQGYEVNINNDGEATVKEEVGEKLVANTEFTEVTN